MTDEEAIDTVCTLFEMRTGDWATIHRNGRILLALPGTRRGALRGLRLYQPQRLKARATMVALGLAAATGLHRWFLPRLSNQGGIVEMGPNFPRSIPYTTGILLGSPEHRVRRAIASYQTAAGWEVAKIAFGPEGWDVIHGESTALQSLPAGTRGAPALLGVHRGDGISLLRLPYVKGRVLKPGESEDAIALLDSWVSDSAGRPITEFSEWAAIESALAANDRGREALESLKSLQLIPAIRHGDFARWNLLRTDDGELMVLDWEWGIAHGMPGIDLVHYFLQDYRLVKRLPDSEAILATLRDLNRRECREYLEKTGWRGNPLMAIIACLAWKQGAGHQENAEVLRCAVQGYGNFE